MGRKAQRNDSLPGSLDMLILRTLSLRDVHGYGIVQFIQQSSDNEFLVEEGSLYPALQRLELNGWTDGVWGVTSNNRRARIYKITAAGRKQLAVETRQYAKLAQHRLMLRTGSLIPASALFLGIPVLGRAADYCLNVLDQFRRYGPEEFGEVLDSRRPPLVGPELAARTIAALPKQGEVKRLTVSDLQFGPESK
jgi:PadR family transcriptional regulator PadR